MLSVNAPMGREMRPAISHPATAASSTMVMPSHIEKPSDSQLGRPPLTTLDTTAAPVT